MITQNAQNTGIISPQDLKRLIDRHHAEIDDDTRMPIKIIDATFVMPDAPQSAETLYQNKHIENALFFDIVASANPDTSVPNMLPIPPDFERMMAALGINNADFIVVYGSDGMVMGPPRLWWMLRVFGHDKVCVLDGGLPAWEDSGFPVTNKKTEKPERGTFKSSFRPELLKSKENMLSLLSCEKTKILDARSFERFCGGAPEPRADMRSGHIPGSCNLPAKSLVNATNGRMKPAEDIEVLLRESGYTTQHENLVTSCGSGITACMLALALYSTGYKNVPVYDGSWSEWGAEHAGTPIGKL